MLMAFVGREQPVPSPSSRTRKSHRRAFIHISNRVLKPIGTIGDPPGQHARGNGGEESPPKGQNEVCDDSDGRKGEPENFALHEVIVANSDG
jgi:hypothetical protein